MKERNITVHYNKELISVDGDNQIAYFKNENNKIISTNFDLLHAPPPQSAPNSIKNNLNLSDNNGYINVNKYTLQSIKYENVFSLGDCSNIPTSKTGAAIYSQTPILINNLQQVMIGNKNNLNAKYDGYTSCPIFIGNKKLILAEFKYNGIVKESFPIDQGHPNSLFYYLKRYLLSNIIYIYININIV